MPKLLRSLLVTVAVVLASLQATAGEVHLEEGVRTIKVGATSITVLKGFGNDFYYLPTNLRLAKDDKNEPALMLLKYRLPSRQKVVSFDDKGQSVTDGLVGGVLALQAEFTLSAAELAQAQSELRQDTKNSAATLALIPLDEASITLEYVDPAQKEVLRRIGPQAAPAEGGIVSWVMPLSDAATDIAWDALTKPSSTTANLRAFIDFKYSGYLPPLQVTVSGRWENIYSHSSWNAQASGGYFVFKGRGDYQKIVDSMSQDGTLSINWKGAASPNVEKLVDMLTGKLVDSMFDTSHFKTEEPAKAQAASSGGWHCLWGCGSVSFSKKEVKRTKAGRFMFDFSRREKVSRTSIRFSDFTGISQLKDNPRHFREVESLEWNFLRPTVLLAVPREDYSAVSVSVRYGGRQQDLGFRVGQSEAATLIYGEYVPDSKIPKDERYVWEYKVSAQLSPRMPAQLFPVRTFETAWLKETQEVLKLDPSTWNGPVTAALDSIAIADMENLGASSVLVTVTWNAAGVQPSKTLVFTPTSLVHSHTAKGVFPANQPPRYKLLVRYKGGEQWKQVTLEQGQHPELGPRDALILADWLK